MAHRVTVALLYCRVAAVMLLVSVAVRVRSARSLITSLGPHHTVRRRQSWQEAEQTVRVVDRLSRRWPLARRVPCLRRSLTLYYFLTRLGYPVRVVFGATKDGGRLRAHAWVELE